MRKDKVHTRRETGRSSNPKKPALITLAIAQALAFQTAQAASIEVRSNLDDDTDCTLREAIDTVNAGANLANGCFIDGALGTDDAISFGAGVAGSTIVTNGELSITKSVSINSGGVNITIDANGVERVIFVDGSTVELDQLTLTGGNTTDRGGGIYAASNSNVTLTNSTVSGNSAEGDGGGICARDDSSVTLTNSTVSGNSAGRFGGGIYGLFSELTVNNSTVSGNSAEGDGGGIYAGGLLVTLTNSTVSGNTANYNGGGIYAPATNVKLTNSTVSNNIAGRSGGGIKAEYRSTITLTNSTVSGNSARRGGAISAFLFTNVQLTNSTVSGNSSGSGGGIYVSFESPLTLSNSIVANSSGADCSVGSSGTATATADSIIEDGSCDTAAMAVDPVLGPLADNGGPTQTHALLAGSPAIDNGTGAGATAFDQRGVAAEGVRDSGAYEFTAAMNALMIEKLINNQTRETPADAAQLLAGTRYRADYKVTNNSPDRIYRVRVFEDGQLVCNLYDMMPGQSKQPARCANFNDVLAGLNNVPANVTAKVSGSNQDLANQTDAYYNGFDNVAGKLKVTHYVNNKNADTQSSAATVNGNQAEILFRVENTGSIKLYRVKTYHDPASPVNSGWEEQCLLGALMPGDVRYCKRTINVTHSGLNKAFGRAQGEDANVSPMGYVNASNPSYFNVVLP